jgi:alpha-galactosidase
MIRLAALLTLATLSLATPALLPAADDSYVPTGASNDAVMAKPAEIAALAEWAALAFGDIQPAPQPGRIDVRSRRQDHAKLRFGLSCMETPLQIGSQPFVHGLGTHANSEIGVELPDGAKAFKALVGVDNNYDTQGTRGSVQLAVAIDGKEVFRSPTVRGGDAPLPVEVAIPEGSQELLLKVDTTDDGPAHDQSDWADARIVLTDGRTVYLDEGYATPLLTAANPPFSFVYGGKPSLDLLKNWPRTFQSKELADRTEHRVAWTDPQSKLCVSAVVAVFKRYPAVDWVLSFENQGTSDTPILENIQAVDASLDTTSIRLAPVVHHLLGDVCNERSFQPQAAKIELGKDFRMAPSGGRSSNGAFPMFNVEYGGRGLIAAVGWSGQWAASVTRAAEGPTRLAAGMEQTHLLLHPGERIRSPRILVMGWQGDRQAAHNRWRRLLLHHYVPQQNGRPAQVPVFLQCFDRYSWTNPAWATETGQIEAAEFAHRLGFDVLWLDAAWFVGGFPNGVGNWFCKPKEFPHGLKPVADACHAKGMKFIAWFEPERVAAGTQIAKEHPEFVFGGQQGGLFKLNDPAARRWLADLLAQRIGEFGLDWYRNDFNIDPLSFWRRNDTPDRQGMTEIRYIEGLYAMWDEFRAKYPGLLIDNCASGGRRIDLEMCTRSIPLWRSDTNCSPGHPDWNQAQTLGLSLYLPLHTACSWMPDAYELRSAGTAGSICQWAYLDKNFPAEQAKALLAEIKENRKYWYGDFYPLASATADPAQFAAYQFHRADLNAGLVLAFRRAECNYAGLILGLQGLDPKARYSVEFIDNSLQKVVKPMTGEGLSTDLTLRIPRRGESLIIRYTQQ